MPAESSAQSTEANVDVDGTAGVEKSLPKKAAKRKRARKARKNSARKSSAQKEETKKARRTALFPSIFF